MSLHSTMHRLACCYSVVCILLCQAQQPGHQGPLERGVTDGALATEAREVKRQYDVASLHSDGNWFQRKFAEDYLWYGPNGEVVNKETYIRDLVSHDLVWDSVRVEDMVVRVYGNTAIATGRFFGKGRYKGTPLDERQRLDRKSTRLNSSHLGISYAVFCLKKKK